MSCYQDMLLSERDLINASFHQDELSKQVVINTIYY